MRLQAGGLEPPKVNPVRYVPITMAGRSRASKPEIQDRSTFRGKTDVNSSREEPLEQADSGKDCRNLHFNKRRVGLQVGRGCPTTILVAPGANRPGQKGETRFRISVSRSISCGTAQDLD